MKLTRADKAADVRKLAKKGMVPKEIAKIVGPQYRGKLTTQTKPRESWSSDVSKEIKHLSPVICGQIASYYRQAIQKNEGVEEINQAIKAIPLNLAANNENAEEYHRYCPFSSKTWCQYQLSKFHNRETPNHPNYLSSSAKNQILSVFEDFKYDSPEFVERVSGGHTSNQNESLHNLLYTMIRKTEAIGYETMRLGSALAVIRFNDGFGGIQKLFNALDIEITPPMNEAFNFLDRKRFLRSRFIKKQQGKRFQKKQQRSKSTNVKLKKFGPGYKSGAYSADQRSANISDYSSEEETGISLPYAATSSKATSQDVSLEDVSCSICLGNLEIGLVGVGLGFPMDLEDIFWVQCTKCKLNYHSLCLGLVEEINPENEWYCPDC